MPQRLSVVLWVLALALFFCPSAQAGSVIGERVTYLHGTTELEGYLAYDVSTEAPRPGVLIIHEWKGLGDHAERRARELAALGYMAFALDMYGKGIQVETSEEAAEWSGQFKKDRPLTRSRAFAGLEVLEKHPLTDASRLAAIGYSFGGMAALELARAGAPLKGTVSFHGPLGTPNKEDAKNIKGRVLILHGGSDPHVPDDQVKAFEDEMRAAGTEWQIVVYGKAAHGITNPDSGNDPKTGIAYDADADRDSWDEMRRFFEEIFAPPLES